MNGMLKDFQTFMWCYKTVYTRFYQETETIDIYIWNSIWFQPFPFFCWLTALSFFLHILHWIKILLVVLKFLKCENTFQQKQTTDVLWLSFFFILLLLLLKVGYIGEYFQTCYTNTSYWCTHVNKICLNWLDFVRFLDEYWVLLYFKSERKS